MCILKCVPVSRSLSLSPSLILSLFSVSFCACFPLSKAAAKFQCTQLAQWDKYRFACNETNITSESQWREGNRESEIKRKERSKKRKKVEIQHSPDWLWLQLLLLLPPTPLSPDPLAVLLLPPPLPPLLLAPLALPALWRSEPNSFAAAVLAFFSSKMRSTILD